MDTFLGLCSTQLSMKFQFSTADKRHSCFQTLRCCIYHAKNVKLPITIGILTYMSRINFILSKVEHEKSFITSGPGLSLINNPFAMKYLESIIIIAKLFSCLIIFNLTSLYS